MTFWTPERVEKLKRLHGEGYSASWIAAGIGAPTRNVVIGKLNRLGLAGGGMARTSPPRRSLRVPRLCERVDNRVRLPVVAPAETHPPEMCRVTLLDLQPGQCKFPTDISIRRPATHFCGNDVRPDSPYCAHHSARAFNKPKSPKPFIPRLYSRAGGAFVREPAE